MPVQNEEVTVKRLPAGPECQAVVQSVSGRRLELESAGTAAWPIGTLVEIHSASDLSLGEIKGRRDHVMVISVEHAVNQDALARIAQVWQKKS